MKTKSYIPQKYLFVLLENDMPAQKATAIFESRLKPSENKKKTIR